jgi:hypothetical protein
MKTSQVIRLLTFTVLMVKSSIIRQGEVGMKRKRGKLDQKVFEFKNDLLS